MNKEIQSSDLDKAKGTFTGVRESLQRAEWKSVFIQFEMIISSFSISNIFNMSWNKSILTYCVKEADWGMF